MGRGKRKQDLSPKIDLDEIPSNSKENLKKQKKQVSQEESTQELKVPVQASKAVKPIFIQEKLKEVRELISQIKLQVNPAFKISSAFSTQVIVKTIEDKASVINFLRLNGIQFHTFSEKSEKAKKFVLKGYYEASTTEVLKVLQKEKVPAVKVTVLVRNPEFTFYLVHFQDENVNINVLNHNNRTIDNVIVKWETIKKKNKSPTQCFNCQRWGHSSQSCGYNFRCVKCTETHDPNNCKRTTRDGNPKCINCNGDHAASYRMCPSFISYAERIKISKSKVQKLKMHPQVSPSLDGRNFPALFKQHQDMVHSNPRNVANVPTKFHEDTSQQQLLNNLSYAEKLNEAVKNENLLKKLTDAQERLKKIPNIEEAINKYCNFVNEAERISKDAPPGTAFNLLVKYGFYSSLNTSKM